MRGAIGHKERDGLGDIFRVGWRKEQAHGSRPGAMGLLRSPTHTNDVAEAVAFLVSDRAAHITGAIIDISSGAYMRN